MLGTLNPESLRKPLRQTVLAVCELSLGNKALSSAQCALSPSCSLQNGEWGLLFTARGHARGALTTVPKTWGAKPPSGAQIHEALWASERKGLCSEPVAFSSVPFLGQVLLVRYKVISVWSQLISESSSCTGECCVHVDGSPKDECHKS